MPRRSPKSDFVSASEISTYVYCAEQWRLQHGLGNPSQNTESLERGERHHQKTAIVEETSRAALGLGWLLVLLAVLLGLFVFLLR